MQKENDFLKNYIYKQPFFDAVRKSKMRRQFPRFKVNEEFKYQYNDTESSCSIINISEGGMLLKIPQILEVEDKVKLFFERELSQFKLNAKVVYTDNNYIGINYLEDELYDYVRIKQFINEIK